MSRITRIPTKQGHPVPSRVMPKQGPFPNELYASAPVNTEYEKISGNGGPEIPLGSTAQNNFKPLKWFRCNLCNDVVKESDLSNHVCVNTPTQYEESDEEYYDDDEEYYDEDDDDELSDGRTY